MFRLKLQFFAVLLMLGFNVLAADPLPRVLILGDNFYQNLTSNSAVQEFKGPAQFVYANPGDSAYALAYLEEMLGRDKWNVIHFNLGIADLCYKHPGLKGVRALRKAAGGVRVNSPDLYEKNLSELVRRLKATGAKLIWANTPPPVTPGSVPNYDPGSEAEYNAIAAKVMAAQNVPVNDMHAFAASAAKEKRPPQFKEPFLAAIVAALEPAKK